MQKENFKTINTFFFSNEFLQGGKSGFTGMTEREFCIGLVQIFPWSANVLRFLVDTWQSKGSKPLQFGMHLITQYFNTLTLLQFRVSY